MIGPETGCCMNVNSLGLNRSAEISNLEVAKEPEFTLDTEVP